MSEQHQQKRANDPVGCLFDLFCYLLLLAAAACAWVWYQAESGELPVLAAEMVSVTTIRWLSAILSLLCVLGVVALRLWVLPWYFRVQKLP